MNTSLRRAKGTAAVLTCLLIAGCALPEMKISAAATSALEDTLPVEGSSVTMKIGGIACPQ